MSSPESPSDLSGEPSGDRDRLLELAHAHIEGCLDESQCRELESLLTHDAGARRAYLDFLHDHACLHWSHVAESHTPAPADFPAPWARRFPPPWQIFAAAATIALLALVIVRPESGGDTFATMSRTEAARWESGTLPTAEGSRLGAGDLELVRGLATVTFDSGAELVIEAPARLTLVDAMNCLLVGGTVVAEVGDGAEGFTVATPKAKVVDYGTRFAVNVDPGNGATQAQVFEGLVEIEDRGTRERLSLRGGQRTLVGGNAPAGVSDSPEEGTWSHPDSSELRRSPGSLALTTAMPGGADAYVWAGRPTDHVSETLLLMKNGLEAHAPHRKSYLRFPLDAIAPGSLESARLELHFTPTGWGLASHLDDAEFVVFGLVNDALDAWDADALDWENAPANDPGSGEGLRPESVRELGRFTVPRGLQSGSFGIEGENLRSFLDGDSNRIASLIVVRRTREKRSGGLVHAFASSRHPDLPPPTLRLQRKRGS